MSVCLANQVSLWGREVKAQADWPLHFAACGSGLWLDKQFENQLTETEKCQLGVRNVEGNASKAALSNSV